MMSRHTGTAARPRGSTGTPRASLRQTREGRCAMRGAPLWTSGTIRSAGGAADAVTIDYAGGFERITPVPGSDLQNLTHATDFRCLCLYAPGVIPRPVCLIPDLVPLRHHPHPGPP